MEIQNVQVDVTFLIEELQKRLSVAIHENAFSNAFIKQLAANNDKLVAENAFLIKQLTKSTDMKELDHDEEAEKAAAAAKLMPPKKVAACKEKIKTE
jgi:hypothetical protein